MRIRDAHLLDDALDPHRLCEVELRRRVVSHRRRRERRDRDSNAPEPNLFIRALRDTLTCADSIGVSALQDLKNAGVGRLKPTPASTPPQIWRRIFSAVLSSSLRRWWRAYHHLVRKEEPRGSADVAAPPRVLARVGAQQIGPHASIIRTVSGTAMNMPKTTKIDEITFAGRLRRAVYLSRLCLGHEVQNGPRRIRRSITYDGARSEPRNTRRCSSGKGRTYRLSPEKPSPRRVLSDVLRQCRRRSQGR